MAEAGYKCTIRFTGVPTTIAAEPTTALGLDAATGFYGYRITSAAKRALNITTPWRLQDGSGATIVWTAFGAASFPTGTFYLTSSVAVVTFTGEYFPLGSSQVTTGIKDFTISESVDMLDTTVMDGVSNLKKRKGGLRDASVSFTGHYTAADYALLEAANANDTVVMLDMVYAASNTFRAIALIESIEMSASVDGLVEANISLQITGDTHAETGLAAGIFDGIMP